MNIKKLFTQIPKTLIYAFVSCFLAGFIIHIFAFTNIIPNSDGLSRVHDAQQMTVSGRWFLHYASMFNGYVQLPAVIGFFSVLFMSLSAVLTVDILNIKKISSAVLCGIFMISFPSVAYTYLYMFTASAYFFGIFLAVLSVWIIKNFKFGFLISPIILACAIGTYQAYFSVAVSLSLIYVIIYSLSSNNDIKEIFKTGFKFIFSLILSLIIYFVILQVFLSIKDLSLISYKGADTMMSSVSVISLIGLIIKSYLQFGAQFFLISDFCKYNSIFLISLNLIILTIAFISFVKININNKFNKSKFILILALIILLPLALNLTCLMGDNTQIMRFSLVFTYIFAIALADSIKFKFSSIFTLISSVIILCFFNINNLAYTVSAQAHRATHTFATNLVSRVESIPEYNKDMPVIIIGSFPDKVYNNNIEAFDTVEDYSNLSTSLMPLNKHIYYYLNNWLNVTWQEPSQQIMEETASCEQFKQMQLYPSDNSVKIINGNVVVKLSETFTPKAEYELEYEKRK